MQPFPALPAERAALVERYRALRAAHEEVGEKLARTLPRETLLEAGGELGVARGKELVFGDERYMAPLVDYCFHDVTRDGRSHVQQAFASSAVAPDGDQHLLLEAMTTARFSLYEVTAIVPGVGVELRDLLRAAVEPIVDLGLAEAGRSGDCLAARLFDVAGLTMTTGAALALPPETAHAIAATFTESASGRSLIEPARPGAGRSLARPILAGIFRALHAPAKPPERRTKVGRNEPCPCGSGKKYKKCCAP